jgi:transcriptional regulator NrdR family protein
MTTRSPQLHQIVDSVQCPECNGESRVIDSRDTDEARRRRRVCLHCGHRYTTYEIHAAAYERLQMLKVDIEKVESVIVSLTAIKEQFGEPNGHSKI